MVANVENMMYVKDRPWHGLGVKLDNPPTITEAIEAAGLDWEVGTRPLFTSEGEKIAMAKLSYRMSDNTPLGVVGPRWTPLQNRDAFNVFEPLLEGGDLHLDTAGSLNDGKRVWILAQLAKFDNDVIVKGDEIAKYVLLSNGHDGKLAVHFGFTPIRVVCSNTEAMARNSELSKLCRIRHHANVKANVENLRDVMNLANQTFEATAEQYRFLAGQEINPADLRKYLKIVNDVKTDVAESDLPTRTKNKLNRIEDLFEAGLGSDVAGKTWWGAYNAVTEYLNYEQGRTANNRIDSLWYGQGKMANDRALQSALTLAS